MNESPSAASIRRSALYEVSCPNEADHTQAPKAYVPWHAWAIEKGRTHRQIRCKGCDLYKIWVPR